MTKEQIEKAVEKMDMPKGDLYDLPTSSKTFPDGGNYRVEISGVETPKVLAATIDEARKQGVPFHRSISAVRGASMLTRDQLKEFAKIASDARVEVIITPGPRPTWDIGRQIATPEGAISGLRLRGMDSVIHYIQDIERCIELGFRGFLVWDEGVLSLLNSMKDNGDLPKDIPGRTRAIRDCLKTNERSLALAALLWRSLAECCLDGASPEKRSAEERRAVRETLDALRKATAEWRKEIFEKKIDPYLARGREFMPYMYDMSKAARPIRTAWIMLTEDTSVERWGGPRGAKAEALEGYLDRHPYAEHMQLVVTGEKEPQVFGVHDLLTVGEKDMVVRASQKGKEPLQITLPANAELTYADLLRLGYEQNREKLDAGKPPDVRGWSPYSGCESGGFFPFDLVVARRRLAELEKSLPPQKDEAKKNDWRGKAAAVNCWLADFWMF